MSHSSPPVWFITGCSTGFGRELARLVLDRGWSAVVTARNPAQVADLVEGHERTALALRLDVTKPDEIAAAVHAAQERFGQIDVLVNNAGYAYLAAVEEGEDSEVRAMFEANFFGLAAMTQAVLPGMRARRSGHIVNISSIGGLASFAATGYYHATKYAVEGLSESLALEVAPLGIRVTIVEPGPFRTNWAGPSIKQSAIRIPDYDETAGVRRTQTAARSGKRPGDPVRAAEAIIAAVEASTPPLHLVLGKPALDIARGKVAALTKDFETWEATTLGADYPEGAGADARRRAPCASGGLQQQSHLALVDGDEADQPCRRAGPQCVVARSGTDELRITDHRIRVRGVRRHRQPFSGGGRIPIQVSGNAHRQRHAVEIRIGVER
jgi:NAD(P)-dependent dehydrogenase (short-subunit alcohol dehydrogenase family)